MESDLPPSRTNTSIVPGKLLFSIEIFRRPSAGHIDPIQHVIRKIGTEIHHEK
jgi:hypothetical protein